MQEKQDNSSEGLAKDAIKEVADKVMETKKQGIEGNNPSRPGTFPAQIGDVEEEILAAGNCDGRSIGHHRPRVNTEE